MKNNCNKPFLLFCARFFFLSSHGDKAFSLWYSKKCNNFIFLRIFLLDLLGNGTDYHSRKQYAASNSAASQALNTAFKADGCSSVLQLPPEDRQQWEITGLQKQHKTKHTCRQMGLSFNGRSNLGGKTGVLGLLKSFQIWFLEGAFFNSR